MNNKQQFLLKNIGLFTIGSFGSKILSFLLVPLYTTLLTTTEYGYIDLITSTVSLLTPILLLSIFDATLRFGMDTNYDQKDVISTSIRISFFGTILLIVVVLLISITKIIKISNIYLLFLIILFVLGAINQIFSLYLRAINKASVIAISGILCTLVSCTSNVLLLLIFRWGIIGYMISNLIGIFFQNIYQLLVGGIYKDIKIVKYNNLSKPMIKYSFPLIANSISWWINNASDRYILTFFKGVAENGIYSVSYKVPTILTMFQGIFYNAWSISAIKEFDKNDEDGFIGLNYTIYSLVSLIVCSVLLLFNIPIAKFLYQGNYFIAWKCVPFLLMGTVFSGISQFEGSLFAATKQTKLVAKTTIIGAIVNTICNILFIKIFGAIGAAFATLLGYFVTWILRTKYIQTFVKMKVVWKKHFLSIVLVFAQSIFATLGINLIQLIIFCLLLFINKQAILIMIKKIKKN